MNISTIVATVAVALLVYTFGSNSLTSEKSKQEAKEYRKKMTPLFEQANELGKYEWGFKCRDLSITAADVMSKRQEKFDLDLLLDGLQNSEYFPAENNIILGYVAQAYASPIVPKEEVDQVVKEFASKKQDECLAKSDFNPNLVEVDDPNQLERIKKQKALQGSTQYFLAYNEDRNQQTNFKVIAKVDMGKNGIPINFRNLNQEIELAVKGSAYSRTKHGRGDSYYMLPVTVVVVSQKERNVTIQVFTKAQKNRAVGYDVVKTVELVQDSNGELDLRK